jgi:hypothetical protein
MPGSWGPMGMVQGLADAKKNGGKFDFNHFGWGHDGQTAQGMGAGDQTPAQGMGAGDQTPAQGPVVHDSGAPDVPGPIETGPGNVVQPGPNIGPSDYGQGETEKKHRWINALQGGGRHRWKGY